MKSIEIHIFCYFLNDIYKQESVSSKCYTHSMLLFCRKNEGIFTHNSSTKMSENDSSRGTYRWI